MAQPMPPPPGSTTQLAAPASVQYVAQPVPSMAMTAAPYMHPPVRMRPIGQNGFNPCLCVSLRIGCYAIGGFLIVSRQPLASDISLMC